MTGKSRQRAPRILLYGFGPYRQFTDNITARIIKALPVHKGLKKVIFPVRFDRRQFVDAIRKHKPDAILGLGQSSRKTIDLESRARNWRRSNKSNPRRPIANGRPKTLPTTLNLKAGGAARRSLSAGDYVCNYSMYVMLDELRRSGDPAGFGFVHVPHDFPTRAATALIRKLLRQISRRGTD